MSTKKGLCDKRCTTCKYRTGFAGGNHQIACYYYGHTNKRRPCPVGKECTVYEKGKALGNKSLKVIASRGGLKRCKACGKEFMATANNQRLCRECSERRIKARRDAYYAEKRAERREQAITEEKTCVLCGKTYHSATKRVGYCPDCKALSKHTQLKMREQRDERMD